MTAEGYLTIACKNIPVVNRVIQKYGDIPLSEYLKKFMLKPAPSYQPRDDFFKAVYQYAASLMGESLAYQTVHDLEEYPVILTSNHLGVEYFSQSLQSSILFALGRTGKTAPVFSFGNIPLNNLTYPRGALLYNISFGGLSPTLLNLNNMPVRLPVFPERLKRGIAGIVPGFDRNMIQRAESRLDKMLYDKHISQMLADTMHIILQNDYCDDSVIKLTDYSQQSVIMNRRIWKRLFSESDKIPELIYLEIEKIASSLLENDLSNPESLVWRVMFDSALREKVIENLENVNGCWERKRLEQRLKKNLSCSGCGTLFFWEIDNDIRRIPLYLETNCLNSEMLKGIDDHGKIWEIPFMPEIIIQKLKEKQIIPSLFTTFLTISLARGIICLGGYFQADYLPAMQRGVVNALRNIGDNNAANLVAQVPTDGYLSGMLAVMTKTEDDYLIPAGAAEIITRGGITHDNIDKMLSLTVRDAHIAGLFETVPDAVSQELRHPDWKKDLAGESFHLLKEKILS